MSKELRDYMQLAETYHLPIFGITAPDQLSRGQFHLLRIFETIQYYKQKYANSDADVVLPF